MRRAIGWLMLDAALVGLVIGAVVGTTIVGGIVGLAQRVTP